MAIHNKNAAHPQGANGATKTQSHSNSAKNQCTRLLQFMRERGAIATSDAREWLSIHHPAGRVKDLRDQGHDIVTLMRWVKDGAGVPHRQAVYVLRFGADGEGA